MSLLAFFEQLAESSWSIDLHESQYAYSFVESIHVWTLCVFFGTVAIVDLRLLGWTMRGVPVSEFAKRMLPWTLTTAAARLNSVPKTMMRVHEQSA